MANGQSQGLQVALIIFVMLTIALGVTAFLFYSNYSDLYEDWQADKQRADNAVRDFNNALQDIEQLKRSIGYDLEVGGPDDPPGGDTVMGKIKADIDRYGGETPEKDYRHVLEYMGNVLNTLRSENVQLAEDKRALEEMHRNRESVKQAEIAQQEGARQHAEQDLQTQTAQYEEDRRRKDQDVVQFADAANELRRQLDQLRLDSEARERDAAQTISEQRGQIDRLSDRIKEITGTNFEVPDGQIVHVDQGAALAWINLGRADYLYQQETFSVYDASQLAVAEKRKKADIEVTNIIGPHLAEARITGASLTDPVLPGDKVYTPVWHPGRKEGFALAGFMDLEGDGTSDRQRVREIIVGRGGQIDAEVADNGLLTGEISINTKYLVLGDEPVEGQKAGPQEKVNAPAMRQGMTELINQARDLGVQIVPLARFLDLVGWQPRQRLLTPGVGRYRAGVTPGGASEGPPTAGTAY